MFKINKDLRRLGVVSVSALMLLGVGTSAMGNTSVHADSDGGLKYVAENTPVSRELAPQGEKLDREYLNRGIIATGKTDGLTAQQSLKRAKVLQGLRSKNASVQEYGAVESATPKTFNRVIRHAEKIAKGPRKPADPATKANFKRDMRIINQYRNAKRHNRKAIKRSRRAGKRTAKRAIKGIDASRYTRALRKSNYVLRHGRRHAKRYIYRTAKKFTKANNAEKKAYHKFARKHTNRNRKAVNKAITNLNSLVNALLK